MPSLFSAETIAALRDNEDTEVIAHLLEKHRCDIERLPSSATRQLVSYVDALRDTIKVGPLGESWNLWGEQLEAQTEFVRVQLLKALGSASSGDSTARPLLSPRKSWQVKWSDIVFQTDPSTGQQVVLGEGGFGKVYAATYKGAAVAVKRFHRGEIDHCLDLFKQEVGALSRLRHPAIIGFYGATLRNPADPADPSDYAIVMERGAITLLDAMNAMRDEEATSECEERGVKLPMTIDERLKLLQSLAEALMYLHHHDPPIVLQDIKPSNVILTADGKAKFIDFGIVATKATTFRSRSELNDRATAPARIGYTRQYAAPEVLRGEITAPHPPQDIYSFGQLCYELLTGAPKWGQRNDLSTIVGNNERVAELFRIETDDSTITIPPRIVELVVMCTQFHASERPPAELVFTMLATPHRGTKRRSTLRRAKNMLKTGCAMAFAATSALVMTTVLVVAAILIPLQWLHEEEPTLPYVLVSNANTTRLNESQLRMCNAAHRFSRDYADMFHAIGSGDDAAVRALLMRNVSADACSPNQFALHAAVAANNSAAVALLIENGAQLDVYDATGWTALIMAAHRGYESIVRLLLAANATATLTDPLKGRSPLYYAAERGHIEVVRLLLDHAPKLMNLASRSSNATPMHAAAREDQLDVVKILLEHGDDLSSVDTRGRSPICVAAQNGHARIVDAMLAAKPSLIEERCLVGGKTLLFIAAESGYLDVAKVVVERGVDVDAVDFELNSTALIIAADAGRAEVAAFLLDVGANANAMNANGETALSTARKKKRHEVVAVLTAQSLAVKPEQTAVSRFFVFLQSAWNAILSKFLTVFV